MELPLSSFLGGNYLFSYDGTFDTAGSSRGQSAMASSSVSARDPAFYRWHGYIETIFQRWGCSTSLARKEVWVDSNSTTTVDPGHNPSAMRYCGQWTDTGCPGTRPPWAPTVRRTCPSPAWRWWGPGWSPRGGGTTPSTPPGSGTR